ncbi:MAG: HAD-IA family hydrolase [Actinobacteria bacterium]|nr:HAD-IA family hydrolase [Actinomycetota bacterium]
MSPAERPQAPPTRIGAVLLDLDDTLYPQQDWLEGALDRVAEAGARYGADWMELRSALGDVISHGSDSGKVIDQALAQAGFPHIPVAPLVEAFRSHAPEHLDLYPGVAQTMTFLKERAALALITDGDPAMQMAKLSALHIEAYLDAVVISDALGREYRKPHPLAFTTALERLGAQPEASVMVGDRPDKDIAGAARLGIATIRVLTGEYKDLPNEPSPWATVKTFEELGPLLEPFLIGTS